MAIQYSGNLLVKIRQRPFAGLPRQLADSGTPAARGEPGLDAVVLVPGCVNWRISQPDRTAYRHPRERGGPGAAFGVLSLGARCRELDGKGKDGDHIR